MKSRLSEAKKKDIFDGLCRVYSEYESVWYQNDMTIEVLETIPHSLDQTEIGIMTLKDKRNNSEIKIKYSVSIYEFCQITNWLEEIK
ncbi:MAG TPA: hypothetical protein VLE02_01195 [Nitrosarchaeum sp.]|nr:hypothetical protein [Nitrosarchaeum sp.]